MTVRARNVIISCIFIVLIIILLVYPKKVVTKDSEEFIEKIDSSNSKIDSIYFIKDSIQEKIDTIYIKLQDNNKQYEEDINRIVTNTVNEDYSLFLNYISSNTARLDSIYNSY